MRPVTLILTLAWPLAILSFLTPMCRQHCRLSMCTASEAERRALSTNVLKSFLSSWRSFLVTGKSQVSEMHSGTAAQLSCSNLSLLSKYFLVI